MADNKKYYWLKLRTDFFNEPVIKVIENMPKGDLIIVSYLHLLLMSVPSGQINMPAIKLAQKLEITQEELQEVLQPLLYFQLAYKESDGSLFFPYVTKKTVYASQEITGRDRNTAEYKAWRTAVFMRDNFTCRECGKHGIKLNAHHIKPWRHFPAARFDINNGITLCEDCHKAKHRSRKHG